MNKENNEEYLDDLLNVAKTSRNDKEKNNKMDKKELEDEIFHDLDEEFHEDNVEGFLRDFEAELKEESSSKMSEIEATLDIDMLNNLDHIVSEVSEKNQSNEDNPFEEIGLTDSNPDDFSVLDGETNVNTSFKAEELFGTNNEKEEKTEKNLEDKDIIELLDENIDDEDLADISELLKMEENNEFVEEEITLINSDVNNTLEDDINKSDNIDSKKEKKKKIEIIPSFLQFLNAFHKKDKKQLEKETEKETMQPDENLEILKELEEEEKEKKTTKKKKEKKPKKNKANQVKKEKKRKVKQKVVEVPSEPLPKVPVILFLALGVSIVILTMTATKLAGYKIYSKQAKAYFNDGKYRLAYERLQGMKLQQEEQELLEKISLLSSIEQEKVFCDHLYELHMYADALDSLVKGVERYRNGYSKAENLGVLKQFQKIGGSIESALDKKFRMTADQAMKLRKIEDKKVYTKKINEIVKKQGLAIDKE